jgi:aspartate racemase
MKQTSPVPRGVGLIGGLGIGATLYYYRQITHLCQQRGFAPHLTIAHADIELVLPLIASAEREQLAQYLAGFVTDFRGANLAFAAVSAVAPHICFAELLNQSALPMVSLLEVTRLELERLGLQRVTLFGNRMSMQTRLFGGLPDVEVVLPEPIELTLIHDTYTAIAKTGFATLEQTTVLRDLAHLIRSRDNVQAVVLAGTDLSIVFDETNTDFPAVDCAKLHVEAIVERLAASFRS